MKKNVILQNILYLFQGAIVGVAAILPGVSGGVLCAGFGIYQPIMELLSHPMQAIRKHYKIFIPFTIGWLTGFILLARGVELIFSASAPVALMLFFGLICGTLPELFKTSELRDGSKSWTPLVISLSAAYLFFRLLENGIGIAMAPNFWSFLLCGILWGFSLIIPGMNSSSLLIYLGLFDPMTAGIGAMDLSVILPMLAGILAVSLSLARLVNMLFEKHYALISRIVLGFVIASALTIVPTAFEHVGQLILSLVCFGAGFALARVMDVAIKKQEGTSLKEGREK